MSVCVCLCVPVCSISGKDTEDVGDVERGIYGRSVGRVGGPGGTPHRGDGGQVTAVAQHRDLYGAWWWDIDHNDDPPIRLQIHTQTKGF